MTGIALYEYYNRDHIPIPKYIVDLTYDENAESSFVAYKNVTDQNGGEGDLNGGGGKQWLGLFTTKDEDAGDPIMAPDGERHIIQILKGSSGKTTPSGLSPLHMFGYPNTPQNLTYSDGESGWSFNDDKGGTYLYFERDPDYAIPVIDEEDEAVDDGEAADESEQGSDDGAGSDGEGSGADLAGETGTIKTASNIILVGGIGALLGLALGLSGGILGTRATVKKKKKDQKSE